MPHRYTKEQKMFIHVIAPGRYNSEIADLFNVKFGTCITESQIRSFKINHKIKSNVTKRRRTIPKRLFSKEQVDFILKNVKGLPNQKLAELVNETFNLSITAKQMKTWKGNHDLSSGLKGSEGIEPPNKGTKGLYNVGGNRTSFKKGQKPINYKPVGSEYIDRDGYTLIKVSDKGTWPERWKFKHRVMWEKENGPVPKGYVLLFADSNKQNIDLENLIMVSKHQLLILNKNKLIQNNADLTRTGVIIADLHKKINNRKKVM